MEEQEVRKKNEKRLQKEGAGPSAQSFLHRTQHNLWPVLNQVATLCGLDLSRSGQPCQAEACRFSEGAVLMSSLWWSIPEARTSYSHMLLL